MTISLPPAMFKQMERVRKEEKRTRSELMREAWQHYFESRYSVVAPAKAELAAIRRGRAEIKTGRFVRLDQLRDELATQNRRPSTNSGRSVSR